MSAKRIQILQGHITSPVTLKVPGVYVARGANRVEDAVLRVFKVEHEDLFSKTRTWRSLDARYACYLLLYESEHWSTERIGRFLNGRDHTTVICGMRKARELAESDPRYREKLNAARAALGI